MPVGFFLYGFPTVGTLLPSRVPDSSAAQCQGYKYPRPARRFYSDRLPMGTEALPLFEDPPEPTQASFPLRSQDPLGTEVTVRHSRVLRRLTWSAG